VGDRIICLRNHRSVGVLNGTRGSITAIDPAARTVTFHRDDSGEDVALPSIYLDAGWVDHAYAITAHKAQGLTCETTFVLADDTTYREWGYVAMSRGRTQNRLYLVEEPGEPDPPDDASHPRVLQTDEREPDERLAAELQRSHRQAMALDHLRETDRVEGGGSHAAVFAPPAWARSLLGERPRDRDACRVWLDAVKTVQDYRAAHGVTDPEQPLGARPDGTVARDAYQQALHVLLDARRRLATQQPEPATPAQELGAELA
jgi:hypothetical protein